MIFGTHIILKFNFYFLSLQKNIMTKRIFYLTLMWLWNIMFLSTTFYLSTDIESVTIFFTVMIAFVLFFYLISLVIFGVRDVDVDPDTYCYFFIGFLTLFRKKIYYSDLGYFWIRQSGNLIIVSKQSWFFTKALFTVYNNGDIESIKNSIKKKLEDIYKEELEEKRKKKLIQGWDGYIDIVSKRDDIINKIIK